uniref:Retrovirus-related Pol polyprotein from transposon TNT 1-94 n=1 Tax=Tanacetum cinerariifolium TaxID=118510 RepID=A0A6L2KKD3_TANCI|nr:retrovirus-related Pol polyprotein from transposon TNT 1-94 [Tanacetum cinerariifolium]
MHLIQSLASKELVRNLPKLKFDQHFCDAYKMRKQAYASYKARNIVSTSRCLELLHMDLFGPSAVRSYEGNRYTLVIVDEYSRYTWTRFLKEKTEAFTQFEIFSKKIQNKLGCTMSIRTDHGRELDNEVQFEEFCNDSGITHNFSAPRTPQSNGAVERKNMTLQEMSWTMLNEQSFPQKFCKAYIILNKHTRKVEESLNLTFDETPPPSKTSPLVDEDLDEEEAIKVTEKKNLENNIVDGTLEIDEIVNIKESRNHPIENVIGNLNQRTLRLESIRILSAYACALDFKLFQMDVKSAFLNGFVNEEVYMAQPPGFIDFKKPDHVYKLKKDNTLFTKKKSPNLIIVQIYVDDIIFGLTCQDMCDEFAKIMHDEFKISMIGCYLTSWFSKKQTALAISTTEAEYVSAKKGCQQALWMKQALIDYDVRLDDVPIMCDNKGAIDLSKNPVQHSRTKHIEIRHHFLRDNVQKGHNSIKKVPFVDNIADILTKPLKRESFNNLRLGLGMMEHIPYIILIRFSFFCLNSSTYSIPYRDNLNTSSEVLQAFLIHEIQIKMSLFLVKLSSKTKSKTLH